MSVTLSQPTADYVTSTLNGAIIAGATSATIGTGLNLPATNGVLQIDYDSVIAVGLSSGPETIFYTTYTSGTGALAGITRGVAGTTGVAHSNGAKVQQSASAYWFGNRIIRFGDLSAGMVAQIVSTSTTAFATGTTTMPWDDTIPQSTEGDQYMSLAITPKSATNILVIECFAQFSNSAAALNPFSQALFQDSTANALAANSAFTVSATGIVPIPPLVHSMTSGTTAATTFKLRAGLNAGSTTTFNGSAGARIFGAITKSSMKITEYVV